MSVLEIVAWPDQRLSKICAPVQDIDDALRQLVGDMFETMYDAPGRGLAAPQIGVLSRVFVMDATWKEGEMTPLACINPVISPIGDDFSANEEACLSIVGVSARVTRPNKIELAFTDLNGAPVAKELEGFSAICAQHELDHLDGNVIFDRLDRATREKLEADYRNHI